MRLVSKLFPFLAQRTALLLSGFLVSNISNAIACIFLYHLTKGIFNNQRFARLVTFCYGICPASVFTQALYTEPVFAMWSFGGMYLLFVKNMSWLAFVFFFISGGVRSNGIVNALFIFCYAMQNAYLILTGQCTLCHQKASSKNYSQKQSSNKQASHSSLIKRAFLAFLSLVPHGIQCILLLLPTLLYEEYAFCHCCLPPEISIDNRKGIFYGNDSIYEQQSLQAGSNAKLNGYHSSISPALHLPPLYARIFRRVLLLSRTYPILKKFLPKDLFDSISLSPFYQSLTDVASAESVTLRPWCVADENGKGGSIYGHVQSHYWNVGPFHYFTLLQLPNHLLCFPILGLSCAAIASWILYHRKNKKGNKHEHMNDNESKQGQKSTSSTESSSFVYPEGSNLFPFVLHLGLMTAMYPIIHAQVMTRFLNNSPILFWFFARILWNMIYQIPKGKDNQSQNLNKFKKSNSNRKAFAFLFYSIGYALCGTLLFSTFNPWT
eukprot:MONOS_7093.1-p1 / transcript=MONOS_7093.1 / gene=MONOS_7093 / organism=Monocercomonoides_exilis_PA203 / gene_product=unspecified product / transcript_product=unspecified product / location=Mono_scaffold00235:57783-59541(+) / protein_length=492 / sequence_SO=supercontig / SO=protein_coding / is_pseudo=false